MRLTKPEAAWFRQLTKLDHGPRGLKWGEAMTRPGKPRAPSRRAAAPTYTTGPLQWASYRRTEADDEYRMEGGELKVPSVPLMFDLCFSRDGGAGEGDEPYQNYQ